MADNSSPRSWRAVLRALHRDAGYLAVGLTLIYAMSGLAVNHIDQWDPNFYSARDVHQLGRLPDDTEQAVQTVLARLHIERRVRSTYRAATDRIDVQLDRGALHINPQSGRVVLDAQRPRFVLRIANWLHLNRGKRAWTVIADLYAIGLLLLAISGLFMLPGRKGIAGRGAILVGTGIAIPLAYVVLSGGP